jgi:hypothetical protein
MGESQVYLAALLLWRARTQCALLDGRALHISIRYSAGDRQGWSIIKRAITRTGTAPTTSALCR